VGEAPQEVWAIGESEACARSVARAWRFIWANSVQFSPGRCPGRIAQSIALTCADVSRAAIASRDGDATVSRWCAHLRPLANESIRECAATTSRRRPRLLSFWPGRATCRARTTAPDTHEKSRGGRRCRRSGGNPPHQPQQIHAQKVAASGAADIAASNTIAIATLNAFDAEPTLGPTRVWQRKTARFTRSSAGPETRHFRQWQLVCWTECGHPRTRKGQPNKICAGAQRSGRRPVWGVPLRLTRQ
jgi:hypothetical protein